MIQEIAEQINKEEIRQYWSFLESMPFSIDKKELIEQKIRNALDKVQDTRELDTIIAIFEDLQKEVDSIVRSIPNFENNPTIILLLLALLMLRDFYYGVQSLEDLENAKATPEIYWSVLYNCVDRLEGVLARIKQIQNIIPLNQRNELVTFIEIIFQKILLEIDRYPEEEQFHNEQVAIRRTVLSGFQLSQWIREQSEVTRKMQAREKALQKLKQRVESRKNQERQETRGDQDLQDDFYQLMDSFRPKGWKLYTNE
ncbi:hypothetical protein V0288_07175 [Pannus brasiliensis CCIBt3594]|uniref:Uncharacterized protein n=1 Tax=Pannus brasiliensis CCIBt3594 TaxID=1427578 RepID=A0AAW9QSH2_9CHRO